MAPTYSAPAEPRIVFLALSDPALTAWLAEVIESSDDVEVRCLRRGPITDIDSLLEEVRQEHESISLAESVVYDDRSPGADLAVSYAELLGKRLIPVSLLLDDETEELEAAA